MTEKKRHGRPNRNVNMRQFLGGYYAPYGYGYGFGGLFGGTAQAPVAAPTPDLTPVSAAPVDASAAAPAP